MSEAFELETGVIAMEHQVSLESICSVHECTTHHTALYGITIFTCVTFVLK